MKPTVKAENYEGEERRTNNRMTWGVITFFSTILVGALWQWSTSISRQFELIDQQFTALSARAERIPAIEVRIDETVLRLERFDMEVVRLRNQLEVITPKLERLLYHLERKGEVR